jgi:hypothetical protein
LKRGRDKRLGMQKGELLEDVGCLRGWRVRLPGWYTKRGIGHNFSSCRSLPLATASLSLLPLLSKTSLFVYELLVMAVLFVRRGISIRFDILLSEVCRGILLKLYLV